MTKDEINEEFGKRILALREARNMTRHRLGILVQASGQQVESWEKGASPSVPTIYFLAEVLSTTPNYLIWGKD